MFQYISAYLPVLLPYRRTLTSSITYHRIIAIPFPTRDSDPGVTLCEKQNPKSRISAGIPLPIPDRQAYVIAPRSPLIVRFQLMFFIAEIPLIFLRDGQE